MSTDEIQADVPGLQADADGIRDHLECAASCESRADLVANLTEAHAVALALANAIARLLRAAKKPEPTTED